MNQTEIDKFIQSEVIEVNGKFFISKEKATTMLVEFAEQELKKETANLNDALLVAKEKNDDLQNRFNAVKEDHHKTCLENDAIKSQHDKVYAAWSEAISENDALKLQVEELKQSDGFRKNAIDNIWEPAVKTQKDRIKNLHSALGEAIERLQITNKEYPQLALNKQIESLNKIFYAD